MVTKAGLLALLLWGSVSGGPHAAPQRSHSPALDFGFVPAGVYETHAYFEPGAMGILFHMVRAFLYVVQPNPFPRDLITKLAKENIGAKQAQYQKVTVALPLSTCALQAIYYEMGFVVCAVLGVFFVLLVPLVGLCFCMCRCCDNCGGEMHQRQRKNAECQRGFLATMLVATSLIITAGVLCASAANQNLSNQLKHTRRLVNSNMRDLKMFANDTPASGGQMLNIGPLLGSKIHEQLGKEVLPALDAALSMAGAMRETKEALENVSTALETLQDGTDRLQADLVGVRSSLSNTLSDPACSNGAVSYTCSAIRSTLGQLSISANFSGLPDISEQLANVDSVLKVDLSNIVQKGYSSFNDTPAMVREQTRTVVSGLKGMLDGIGANITSFSRMFPIHASMANFTIFLTENQMKIEVFYPQIDQMDFYRWIGCIALCCLVVLILTFNCLGLLCGHCGYDKHASPTTRGCLSNTGGNLLMAGAGFSFIFSWVLMAVVTATFVVGGNVEKLVCEPFENRQLFKLIDTPYLVNPGLKNFLPGMLFQNPQIDLTLESFYSCKDNKGLYAALKLDNIFNVNKFLNSSVYTKDVARVFEDVKVDLKGIVLLERAGRENLIDFSNTGISEINYAAFLAEVNKGVTVVDLLAFANELEARADQLPRGALENALKGHASSIRQIHAQQVVPMEQAMSTLSQSIRLLQRTAAELPVSVRSTDSHTASLNSVQCFLPVYSLSPHETSKYMQNIASYFTQYIDWVKMSASTPSAAIAWFRRCERNTCFIALFQNTFWFGLGCCTVFLIPNIILSVRLAKFYRRMDTEDVYDE
uniref:Prominin 1 b n=1 Tax=Scleropages formosus TaxID=113540 RepID=A0A8C9VEM6_SCLFO